VDVVGERFDGGLELIWNGGNFQVPDGHQLEVVSDDYYGANLTDEAFAAVTQVFLF
jgi:hypothetical protein